MSDTRLTEAETSPIADVALRQARKELLRDRRRTNRSLRFVNSPTITLTMLPHAMAIPTIIEPKYRQFPPLEMTRTIYRSGAWTV